MAPDVVAGWQAVPPFAAQQKVFSKVPQVDASTYKSVAVETNGAVLLHRLGRTEGARINATVVRLEIAATGNELRAMDLGYSDAASVFLNGQPLVSLDDTYRYARPRVQGVMGFHQARVHLPLRNGTNLLEIVVADSFGGWGIMGRWVRE